MRTYWDAFVEECPNNILEGWELVSVLHLFYEYCNDREEYLRMIREAQQREAKQ